MEQPLDVKCPGARPMAGPPVRGPAVLCGPMLRDQEKAALGQERGFGGTVLLTTRSDRGYGGDPSVVHGFCCARYTECPVWQAEKERGWEAAKALEARED